MSDVEPTTPEPTPAITPEPTTPEPVKPWTETAGFDSDLAANPSITKFKSVAELGRGYVELQKALGGDKIALPGKDAKPEDWDPVHAKLGWPEKVDGYELNGWEPPEGVPWDPEITSTMVEAMHKHRLTKAQAQGMLQDYAGTYAEAWAARTQEIENGRREAVQALQSKWGSAYQTKMDAAKRLAVHFAGPSEEGQANLLDQVVLEDGRKLGDLPEILEMFATLGEAFVTEDSAPGRAVLRTTKTPAEAQKELNAMLADGEKMKILMDAGHPQHKELQQYRTDLEKQAWA